MKKQELKQRNQMRTKAKTALSMLLLPVIFVACGKSEWHEVKAPNTGDPQAEAAHGDLQAGIVQPEQTAFVVPDRLRGRDTADQDPATSTALLERNEPVQIVSAHPVKDPIDGGDLVLVRTNEDRPDAGVTTIDEADEQAPIVPNGPSKTSVARAEAQTNAPVVKRSVKLPAELEKQPVAAKVPVVKAEPVKKVEAAKKSAVTAKPVAAVKPAKRKVYVPLRYLQSKPAAVTKETAAASRFIMIQNIATGKLRVYERSAEAGGPNTMLFETNMINGENEPQTTRRTALGSYKIEKWIKFYQDNAGLAPSWYDSNLAEVPMPGAEIKDWMKTYLLPKKGDQPSGYVRGGFGWYTAKIGPNAHAQWTHGTIGWGADKGRFIDNVSNFELKEFYGDPRTFGCTRVENQAIALLQAILPVGTPVLKVYAKETMADQTLERYSHTPRVQSLDWILSKDEVRGENPHSSSGGAQFARGLSKDMILEEGVYEFDAYPDAVQFDKLIKNYENEKSQTMMVRMEANLYNLPRESFHGEFLVDEGRFVNYQHPSELRKGGYSDQLLPKVVVKTAVAKAKTESKTAKAAVETKSAVRAKKSVVETKSVKASVTKTVAKAAPAAVAKPAPIAAPKK